MQFLANLPANDQWLEVEPETTAQVIVEFITCKQSLDVYTQALIDFKKVMKRITARSLFRLLMHLSTKDLSTRVMLVGVSNLIEDELVGRCQYFEDAHSVPPD